MHHTKSTKFLGVFLMSSMFLNDWFLPVRVTYKNTSTCCLLVSFEISKGSPDQDTTNFRQMYVTCANASVALVKK